MAGRALIQAGTEASPEQVDVQVVRNVFHAHARTATGPERQRPWALGAGQHADWARCQAMTDREIPVVALERKRADGHETTIRGGTQ
jgi:hypothetical protein